MYLYVSLETVTNYTLNNLDTATFGTLQPWALGFLHPVDPLDELSNCYIESSNQGAYMHGGTAYPLHEGLSRFTNSSLM